MNYWLYPTEQHLGMKYVLKTISHLHDVGGADVIGIGTDFDGFTDPPDDLEDMTRLPRLTRELVTPYSSPRRRRYSDSTVKKILGGNALRVLREGWKKD
jgi:membrane dipeptidase